VVARFASTLGLNPSVSQSLVDAAIPTLLALLAAAAGTQVGARRLSELVSAQDAGVLDDPAESLTGAGVAAFASAGAAALSSLPGGADVSARASALARHTGAHVTQTESALALLTPIALAAIARRERGEWSSGPAIAKMFANERDAIQRALPAGLGATLGAGGVSGMTDHMSAGAQVASAAAQRHAQATMEAAQARVDRAIDRDAAPPSAPPARAASAGWLWSALAVVAVGAVAWWLLMGRPAAVSNAIPTTPTSVAPPGEAPSDMAGNGASAVIASVRKLEGILGEINDSASAVSAEPRLREAVGEIEKATVAIGALPAAARRTIGAQVKPALDGLQERTSRTMAAPGVAEHLKPIINPAMAKLLEAAAG
jgi:hypothetical protein